MPERSAGRSVVCDEVAAAVIAEEHATGVLRSPIGPPVLPVAVVRICPEAASKIVTSKSVSPELFAVFVASLLSHFSVQRPEPSPTPYESNSAPKNYTANL